MISSSKLYNHYSGFWTSGPLPRGSNVSLDRLFRTLYSLSTDETEVRWYSFSFHSYDTDNLT
jgi:hypothetical protein